MTTVKTFQRYDTDSSGSIDMEELRNALRKLGLRAGALEAGNILRRYDADESGTIELCEFAVLVRDLQVYAEFDGDCNGAIDAQELYVAFGKLGLGGLGAGYSIGPLPHVFAGQFIHIDLCCSRRIPLIPLTPPLTI